MKTILGWCIVGPIPCDDKSRRSFSCNRIAVKEAGSNKIANHYFAVENRVRSNEEIPAMLKKLYEGEFTEPQVKFSSIIGETLKEVSYEDQQFLKH